MSHCQARMSLRSSHCKLPLHAGGTPHHPGSPRTPPRRRRSRDLAVRMGSAWHCGPKRLGPGSVSEPVCLLGSLGQRFTGTVQWWQRWLGFFGPSHTAPLADIYLPTVRTCDALRGGKAGVTLSPMPTRFSRPLPLGTARVVASLPASVGATDVLRCRKSWKRLRRLQTV